MRRIWLPWPILLAVGLAPAAWAHGQEKKAPAPADIAMYRADPQRTGQYSTADVARPPTVRWQIDLVRDLRFKGTLPMSDGKLLYLVSGKTIHAIDGRTGRVSTATLPVAPAMIGSIYGNWHPPAPIIADGMLYAAVEKDKDTASLQAVNLRTGQVAWQQTLPSAPRAPLGTGQGAVYCICGETNVLAFATKDGSPQWRVKPGDFPEVPSWTVALGQTMFLGGGHWPLIGLARDKGATVWKGAKDGNPASIVAVGGRLFCIAGQSVVAYEANSTEPKWAAKVDADEKLIAPLVASGTTIFAASKMGGAGYLNAYDANTGQPRWRLEILEGAPVQPVMSKKVLYFGTDADEASVFGVEAASGKILWKLDAKTKIDPHWPVLVASGTVCFVKDGVLYGAN